MDQSVMRRIEPNPQGAVARPNLYAGVHKGLRAFMSETLAAVGRADPADADEVARTLGQVDGLLEIALSHVEHENRFMHTAMEACAPGSSYRTADDHVEHLDSIAALRTDVARVRESAGNARAASLDALYRRLARFVAENFEHMEVEETHNMAVLWDALDDAKLMDIHAAIIAAIPPQQMAVFLRWILPSVSHPERAAMLQEMRAGAPAEAFAGALAIACERLTHRDWAKLTRALGLAESPTVVERW